jgi:predicted nucleotidyltransferase
MLSLETIKNLNDLFLKYPKVKLVYFFGSQAKNEAGPLSDYDFAFYLEEKDKKKLFDLKLDLISNLSQILKTNKIDVVILNEIESPELKYNIIKEGKLIYEIEPYRLLIEPRILNDYFDFHYSLLRYNLTSPF